MRRVELPTVSESVPGVTNGEPGAATRRAWRLPRRLLRHKLAFSCLGFLALIHLVVFAGPLFWTLSPTTVDPLNTLAGFSAGHPLGVDDLGRDELSRMLAGGQVTLIVGFVSMIFLVIFGVLIGSTAAFLGGWVDAVLMRLTDTMMAIPSFFFVLVALTVVTSKDPVTIAVVIGASSWMPVTRVVYGETLQWKARDFVEAAYAIGVPRRQILLRHILPQMYSAVIVSATLGIANAILTESAISYLGLGIQPPTASWGNMLKDAQGYIFMDQNLALFPGVAISVVVLAYNLLGDGLRDLLDPRLR
ncbi:MAG TPA: ABC transporter permease [Chloroflexota bacterium]|nr:ABC transporter permease [Chloroflexota bacterium]